MVRPRSIVALSMVLLCLDWIARADVAPPRYRIEPVARGLASPQALALAPDGRIFYLERTTGRVRILRNGKLLPGPLLTVATVSDHQAGLLGIALHPQFAANGFIYLYYSKPGGRNRIERWIVSGNTAASPLVLVDDIGPPSGAGPWDDNGGVHINSGIPNRAFYEAASGSGGFAWERTGRIWYVALKDRLRGSSAFRDAAAATLAAAVGF